MSQYYLVCNIDKRQYLHPHRFGDGLNLREFGASGSGTMLALAVLLADGNNRGGGDLRSDHPIIGSWAGDRIVIAGDYADAGKFVAECAGSTDLAALAARVFTPGYQNPESVTLYHLASETFQDVSDRVIEALCDDADICQELRERLEQRLPGGDSSYRLPRKLVAKLKKSNPPTRPLHVRLAEAVLRAPDEPAIWHGLVDALTEQYLGGHSKRP